MTRADLQKLTRIRLTEARILLRNGCYEGAYYLAGYAVECAIKACIAKNVRRFEFPDKRVANDSHVHDLTKLLGVADIQRYHETALLSDPEFAENWRIVRGWTEQVRYRVEVPRDIAHGLFRAVVTRKHGVLAWVRRYW